MSWKPTLPPFRKYKKEVYLQTAKTSQFIYQLGEEQVIRTRSKEVPLESITLQETKAKIAYLKKCLMQYRKITGVGRGIAAIQVGIPDRFAVIYRPEEKEKLLAIINPQVTKKSEKLLRFPEGCMSEGPIFAPVDRPAWIEFSYYDEFGKKQIWKTRDYDIQGKISNRVFQHEIDHMDGSIFLDLANLQQLTLESDPSFYASATFEEV